MEKEKITSKDGLLYRGDNTGKNYIPLPEADRVARSYGFMYAEQLVKHLEEGLPLPDLKEVVSKILKG